MTATPTKESIIFDKRKVQEAPPRDKVSVSTPLLIPKMVAQDQSPTPVKLLASFSRRHMPSWDIKRDNCRKNTCQPFPESETDSTTYLIELDKDPINVDRKPTRTHRIK